MNCGGTVNLLDRLQCAQKEPDAGDRLPLWGRMPNELLR
jgi:hypothetical protein